ncbi:MAG: peptidase S8/S53 subtilisin kexin sedolisin [Firmicutes bacterium HGW-Firmicutes-19]|jgi:minor extracellular protease Epr|nr:MAG: peptidase S8/S53 subtilisin kexin sedolisin [Firmicutes bacterium HGW-Firmicutes-19]
MKKFRLINIWAIVLACVLLAPIPVRAQPTPSQSVIVVFKHSVDHSLLRSLNANVEKSYKNFPIVKLSLSQRAVFALSKNPNILSIESEVIFTINDDSIEWGIAKVEAPKAWAQNFTGAGVKVGIIDTGIALHEDLIIAGGANFVDTANSYYDDNGHGTHVAGTIAALDNGLGVIGVAPDVSLYAIKVLNSSGSGYLSDIIEGIDFAINEQLDIINMSLGTSTDSPALHTAVDAAYNAGILVVASAGNSGKRITSMDNVGYPAKYESAIAVAATDINNDRATFSSTGPAVEVAAPGVSVRSTYLNNGYASMSGTSMAAPHVSGHLALLIQAFPDKTHTEIRGLLQFYVLDLGTAGRDWAYGYGLIQSFLTETQPPVTKETFTTVTTNKLSYTAGEKITIIVIVVDENDALVSGANVQLTITPPVGKTKVATANLTTGSDGRAVYTYSTNKVSTKGLYTVKAETSLLNYTSSSATTTFTLN